MPLNASVVDVLKAEPTTVFDGQGLKVTALGIPHANMPTLAYRVETRDGSIVFSSAKIPALIHSLRRSRIVVAPQAQSAIDA